MAFIKNTFVQVCLARAVAFAGACSALLLPMQAGAADEVARSFAFAKENAPQVAPGTVIGKRNVEQFRDVLDVGLLIAIRNGWVELRVAAGNSFEVSPAYVESTAAHAGKTPVKLGDAPGEIVGYAGGRPFPDEPRQDDPRAGEKIAWNYRYMHGDGGGILPIQWKYRNMQTGEVERLLRVEVRLLKFKYRTGAGMSPEVSPNPSNLYTASYLKVLEPMDYRNTQLLIQRYDDDTKLDDSYMYYPFQRRVRRLATGQTTDAFLGSDVMIEDFDGYNGRISEMKWVFKSARYMLMPFYNHNEVRQTDEFRDAEGFRYTAFTGQGGCFPDINWQIRKVYVVEAIPVAANHPVSKRVYFFDAQTFAIARSLVYDRKGELWKIAILGKSHPDHHLPINKGSGVPLNDAGSMIDIQAMHCSTGQFKTVAQPAQISPTMFQVQNLRGSD